MISGAFQLLVATVGTKLDIHFFGSQIAEKSVGYSGKLQAARQLKTA